MPIAGVKFVNLLTEILSEELEIGCSDLTPDILEEILSEELEIGCSDLTPDILEEEVRKLDPGIRILTYLHHNREKMSVTSRRSKR